MGTWKMSPPKQLTTAGILSLTYYNKMSNEDRQKVFKAYEYNHKDKVYILTNPEYLNESILKKLSEGEG